ncbi:MAG: GIY-YIG nuclease family protein [Parcubacteria group bacterium]|nr:GIY-YIG nuclease family protein [Parcubacteria group bacterium]
MKFKYTKKTGIGKIPREAGVYSFWSKIGLLYIGKAANLRSRIKNHFKVPSYRDNLFMDQVQKIGYLETGSEIEALLLESRLIKHHQPKYNVMWRDDKNYFYVAITKEDLPKVFLTHQPRKALASASSAKPAWPAGRPTALPELRFGKRLHVNYIGPFTEGKPIKLVLRSLREIFPYYTSRNHSKTLCQYCHLGLCPGPAPDTKQYRKNIRNLVAVLQGKETSVLNNLKKEMHLASQREQYEKAANLRNQVQALEAVFSHSFLFSRAPHEKQGRNYASLEPELRAILGSTKKIARMEAYDISNIQGKETTGSMVVFVKGRPDKNEYRKFKIRLDGKPNDFAMMEELVFRRLAHAEWPAPDFMLIDGGKGQLTAALNAAKSLPRRQAGEIQNPKFKIGALAKRNNELFLPGKKSPLLLSDMSFGLRNILLHIRDEAHRFAISYHRKLHRKSSLG